MLGSAIFCRARTAVARFSAATDGNIAVIFALAAVPILSFVGVAIDYSRANSARSSMQAAMDSAALMVAKDLTDGTITTADINTKAQAYFAALYTNTDAKASATINATYSAGSATTASTVLINGSSSVTTDFMKIAGFPKIDFNTSSTSTWGSMKMRVALVLDNTGSMAQNGKMAALQSAAKGMIDTLSGYNKQTGDVYISIVPFSKDVNVDVANVNQPWINWAEWEAEPPILKSNYPTGWNTVKAGSDCPFTSSTHGFTCMDRPATLSGAQSTSTIPSSGTYAGYICPSMDSGRKLPGKTSIYYNGCYTTVTVPGTVIDSGAGASCGSTSNCSCSGNGKSKVCSLPPTYSHLWRGDGTAATAAAAPAHSTWTGCVNDRDQNYDTSNTAPPSSLGVSTTPSTAFYAEQFADCLPGTVTAMSNQWSTLKGQIDNMYPSGNTNQAVGLAWGWLSLNTSNPPIKAPPKDANYPYQDYIVLLSDGLNTQNRWSTTQSDIDTRQQLLCQAIKADPASKITIFTIQVNINNRDPKSQVLQDCATTGNFQMITTAGQTADAFQNILTQISKLRVAK
ncbi:hypothetical protein JQ633_32970 [Bradyrhizobium tropiciagri]|uniref:TadE/TadG family type IV pilus assembly protein n=1 Tax=Bradyrhizobium tropiciagri TaxID=312253 RepID=UPI001BA70DB6|nr:TadE/TadG family type IV pilus assembly protein [Bradyrhizobium tropiciagri]MBR0875212.1 hypothetical protein [Bradyrhizobium tropiciagri]